MLRFHTPGIPIQSKKKGTLGSLADIKEMGLDGIEIEFTRGVNLGEDKALEIAQESQKLDLSITAHGPFWINLNSKERSKRHAGVSYIFKTAKISELMGAESFTFHAAYNHDMDSDEVLKNVVEMIENALQKMQEAEIKNVTMAPELTGKPSQFGNIEELIKLAEHFDQQIKFCIDFTHHYARTIGEANGAEDFNEIIEKVRSAFGQEFLHDIHMHMGGMIYGQKGEQKHRPLPDEDEFKWKELLQVLKENKVGGWIVIETPDIEASTIVAKEYYESL